MTTISRIVFRQINLLADTAFAIQGLIAAFCMLLLTATSVGQTVSFYDGTNGGLWSSPTRWSNGVPEGNFNAVVNAGLVHQDANHSINRLALGGGTVNMLGPSRTLNLTGTGVGNWALEWYSGSIRRSTNDGTYGVIETASNSYSILHSTGLKQMESIQVNNRGHVNWNGGDLQGSPNISGKLTNWRNLEGSFEVQGDLSMTGIGVFENGVNSLYRKSAGSGVHNVNWVFRNEGTLDIDRGTMRLSAQENFLGGTTYLDWNATSTSAVLEVANRTTLGSGSISGGGAHTRVRFQDNVDLQLTPDAYFYIDVPAEVDVSTASSYFFAAGGNANSRLDLVGPVQFNTTSGATLILGATSGVLNMLGSSEFNGADSSSTFVFGNVANLGHSTWNGGSFNGATQFTNENGARLDIAANNASVFGNIGHRFANFGTIEKLAVTGTTSFFAKLTNGGSLLVGDGTMSFGNAGAFDQETYGTTRLLDATSVLQLAGASLAIAGGFEGIGTVEANTLTLDDGWIAPGLSAGTLTFDSNLHLGSSANLNFELGSTSDLLLVNGDFTLDGLLNVTALSGFGSGVYTLVNFSGSLVDNELLFGTMPSGFEYSILIDQGNSSVNLLVSSVPEPTGSTTILLATCLIARFRLRRRITPFRSNIIGA